MASKTRVRLDLDTKMQVIRASEQDKLPVKQIVSTFNVGKTQVYQILKRRTEIVKLWEICVNENAAAARRRRRRQTRPTANEDINELVWEWFASVRAKKNHKGRRVTGPMIKECARKVAERLGKTAFRASNGWLDSFCKRNCIELGGGGRRAESSQASSGEVAPAATTEQHQAPPPPFGNCNAEVLQTDLDTLIENFTLMEEKRKPPEVEVDVSDKFRVKTYHDAVMSLRELQQFAMRHNDTDMLDVISRAKEVVESRAATKGNCVQKTLLDYWKN